MGKGLTRRLGQFFIPHENAISIRLQEINQSLTAFRAARVTDALIVTHVTVGAKLGIASESRLAGGTLARAGAGLERLALARHELTRENMCELLGGYHSARERGGEHQRGKGGGTHFWFFSFSFSILLYKI